MYTALHEVKVMSERVTFGVDAANALMALGGEGRRVEDKDGFVWQFQHSHDYAPYTLASNEPLTGEQVKAVCMAEPGLCFMLVDGNDVRRYLEDKWWCYHDGEWIEGPQEPYLGPYLGRAYVLVHNPEVPEKAPEPKPGTAEHYEERITCLRRRVKLQSEWIDQALETITVLRDRLREQSSVVGEPDPALLRKSEVKL